MPSQYPDALKSVVVDDCNGGLGQPDWWERPNADLAPWLRWARDAGIAISIDYDDGPLRAEVDQESRDADDIVVWFRPGRAATVSTWAIKKQPTVERHDSGGEPATLPEHSVARRTEVRHLRVVPVTNQPQRLGLEAKAFASGKLRVVFNSVGEPEEFGGKVLS